MDFESVQSAMKIQNSEYEISMVRSRTRSVFRFIQNAQLSINPRCRTKSIFNVRQYNVAMFSAKLFSSVGQFRKYTIQSKDFAMEKPNTLWLTLNIDASLRTEFL